MISALNPLTRKPQEDSAAQLLRRISSASLKSSSVKQEGPKASPIAKQAEIQETPKVHYKFKFSTVIFLFSCNRNIGSPF
jgi:hypothetical protein